MSGNKGIFYLYTSKDYEFIEPDYNTFDQDGIDKSSFKDFGTLPLIILNTSDRIISILEKAKQESLKENMISILEEGLIRGNEILMNVIINDVDSIKNKDFLNYHFTELVNDLKGFKFCIDTFYDLNKENMKNNIDVLSYYGYNFKVPECIIYNSFMDKDILRPLSLLTTNPKAINEIDIDEIDTNEKLMNILKKIKDSPFGKIILKCYKIESLTDLLSAYFNSLTENSIILKKCRNCNLYFIPKSRSDEKYCNRISPQDPKKTCKEYGARKQSLINLKSDNIRNEDYKTKQFYRMRIARSKSKAEKNKLEKNFEKYKLNYQKKKEQYNKGKLQESDFVKWIISQKEV